jgi:flagellar hook assembly protein FlgD
LLVKTSGDNQSGAVRTPLRSPFVVMVTDAGGNPISGYTVRFAIATVPDGATGQSISVTATTTNASGQASTVLTLGDRAGTYTVTASALGLTGSPATFTAIATVTHVETLSGAIPTEFRLEQNYPNPFNPSTTIRFGLPQEAVVRLVIYNMLGEPIRTLIDGEQLQAAHHQVRWDGRDDAGRSVPSGVYLYRMTAGSFQATKRMTLLK